MLPFFVYGEEYKAKNFVLLVTKYSRFARGIGESK
jgi:hypothetical protein